MDLEDLDIKGIIASMPDPANLMMRLAPQEIDRLVSILYDGLGEGAQKIIKQGLKDSDAAYKVFYDAVSEQLGSIEQDLAIKNLAKKFNLDFFLHQALR